MKITRLPALLLASVLAFASFNVLADDHAPPPPAAMESFLCTYNEGQDRDDLDRVTAYYERQAARAGIRIPDSYLWTKLKGASGADVIWHTVHDTFEHLGVFMDVSAAASELDDINARYDQVVDCMPMLGALRPIHLRGESDGSDGNIVASFACSEKGEVGPMGYRDLTGHIRGVMSGMGDTAPVATYGMGIVTSTPSGPSSVFFNVYNTASEWVAFESALRGSSDGQMLMRHFNSTLECSTNIYASEQVIVAE